jgi:DNA-binding MarR family transcriptional regulator
MTTKSTNKYVTINRGKLLNLLKEHDHIVKIYLAMLAVAGDAVHDPSGFIMPIEKIMEFTGISRSSVFRHIRNMEKQHGWIRVERGGEGRSNIYYIESPE